MKTPICNDHLIIDSSVHEQILYDHLLESVKRESPEQVLERFQCLFIKAKGYDNEKVLNSLAYIISSNSAEQKFQFVLNRCCHILINRWQLLPRTQVYIPQLISIFDHIPQNSNGRYIRSFSNKLQELVSEFRKSDYYLQLKRLNHILAEDTRKTNSKKEEDSIGTLINRYPYLYNHCLLSVDSSIEQQQTVYKVKHKLQKNFEINLSKYVTYQIRTAQVNRNPQLLDKSGNQLLIKPVSNPTLLSDKDLGKSLKQYVGTVKNGLTYQDLSKSFITHTIDVRNYQVFKDELYEYIVQSVDPKYGKHRFNRKLYDKLQNTYPQHNSAKPDEFLKVRTYSQIFDYLIVESSKNPQHMVFMDLVSNMGTTETIGLFLQIALVCSKIKPYLEKRFSILFNHYEAVSKDGAQWLIKSLEKLNVAFSSNFGNLDMSFLRRIYAKS